MNRPSTQCLDLLQTKLAQAESEMGPAKARVDYVSKVIALYYAAMTDMSAQLRDCAVGVDVEFIERLGFDTPKPEAWTWELDKASDSLMEKERLVADAREELRRLEREVAAALGAAVQRG